MKSTKLIAVAMFAAMALAIAGRADAAGRNGNHRAGAAHTAFNAAHHAGMWYPTGARQRNRRFASASQSFPYYPYYGNAVYQNSDEADWGEQWTSLYEDNDGPYARSTRENPPGAARTWEFLDK